MTVSYNLDVSSVSSFTWVRLLFRWRGSIWKSVAHELFIWLIMYYIVMFIYRSEIVLTVSQQEDFERLAGHMNKNLEKLPLTFMLGFFVSLVVDRWRQVFNNMGWIENSALTVACLIRGRDQETNLIRRSIVRYLVLSQVLVFRDISMRVRRRFPNMESIVKAGFMHEHELKMLEDISIPYNKYWAPINWAMTLCFKLRSPPPNQPSGAPPIQSDPNLNNIVNVSHVNYILNEIKSFRTNLALLCNFDWVPVPLAYPQVVFLAVRVYFLICLVARQFIIGRDAENKSAIDVYVPFMTCLQFIFYIGWLKVAEALLNPMGEDDDDFECNFLIDKNLATGMAIVDETYDTHPHLVMDVFKAGVTPLYSEDSKKHGNDAMLMGSAAKVTLAPQEEDIKMVEVKPAFAGNDDGTDVNGRANTTMRMRKKLSDSFVFRKPRRNTVNTLEPQPQNLGPQHPDRPNAFDLSFSSAIVTDVVQEVDEEQLTLHSKNGIGSKIPRQSSTETMRMTENGVSEEKIKPN